MANKIPCGKCQKYHEQRKPIRKGGTISLHQGHCLEYTIYASNKPGDHIHPPGAKTEEREFGMHKIELVGEKELRPYCSAAKERK
jgi:hypothetical protein